MKKRIEKARSEKGFTLVELLAVVVILGIILAIAIPAIGNVIAKQKVKAHNANVELILDSARIANAQDEFGKEMKIEELVSKDFLESAVKSPWNEEKYSGTVKLTGSKIVLTLDGTAQALGAPEGKSFGTNGTIEE